MTTGHPASPGPPDVSRRLYDPAFEHDACGIAMVADLGGRPSHKLVDLALTALEHLAHRGATGPRPPPATGPGMLVQVPHRFLAEAMDFDLPGPGWIRRRGWSSCPPTPTTPPRPQRHIEELAAEEGLVVLGWRDVPGQPDGLGASARRGHAPHPPTGGGARARPRRQCRRRPALDRLAFCLRKRVEHEVPGVYISSLSARTMVYKGMLTGHQLREFFPDLSDDLRERARPRPQPLLDQHLPVVAPGPSLPLPGPQRRDQHVAGQPQLDAGPRGAARERPHPGRPRAPVPDLRPGGPATRPPSTRCSSCCTSGGAAWPTPCS